MSVASWKDAHFSILHPGNTILQPGNMLNSASVKLAQRCNLETSSILNSESLMSAASYRNIWILHPEVWTDVLHPVSCLNEKDEGATETHWPRQSNLFKSLAEEGNYCEIHPSHSADSYLSYPPPLSQHISRPLKVYVWCTRTFLRKNRHFSKKNVKSAQKNIILSTSPRQKFYSAK